MSDPIPPPIPQESDRRILEVPPTIVSGDEGRIAYNILADKVGGVPNIRLRDNLYQALTVAVFLIIGVAVGWAVSGWPGGALVGALVGLIAGILTSGAVLLIIGLYRKP